jgi:class 3 adenylate cyclase/pimeloyl-ACP methyl ester carboxylesterase
MGYIMRPRIQYARTTDGVNIAYFVLGEGLPLLWLPAIPYSHLELEWADAGYRSWDERIGRGKMLVRYDNRGSGLSDREISRFDLEGLVLDAEAVLDKLGLDEVAIGATSQGCSPAICFAAKFPQRVSRLILVNPFHEEAAINVPSIEAARSSGDWEFFTQTVAHAMLAGWDEGSHARSYARLMREAVDAETILQERRSGRFPVGDLLGSIECPTLVLHRREAVYPPIESGRRIAAGIRNAELVVLEGSVLMPWVGDMEAIAGAVDRFLGVETPAVYPASRQHEQAATRSAIGLATILFTDVEGSTALTDRMGDAAAREVLREHERITREVLRTHGGSEVKTMGDGFMASFGSATKALECAIAIQRAFEASERTDEVASGGAIRVRCGLNAGEPIAEDNPDGRSDLFGTAVIVAARIAAQAEGGEILVSDVVRQLVAGKGFLFNDRGEHALKGFEDPVRLWEVRWSS